MEAGVTTAHGARREQIGTATGNKYSFHICATTPLSALLMNTFDMAFSWSVEQFRHAIVVNSGPTSV
jgi:hypothetical protein